MNAGGPICTETLLTAGIDVGSSAVKVAIVRDVEGDGASVLSGGFERIRRRDPGLAAEAVFNEALEHAGVSREDLSYVATTGEGETVSFRTGHFYGMTAHARGALFLDPEARTAMDVGALHGRAIVMDDRAKVLGHRMTNQCASGSGQFLENISRYLGVTLADIGPLSLKAKEPESCSSICAVLAETDVINMVSRGVSIPDILKGIHQSMAGRFLRLLTSVKARSPVLVTGGLAADCGFLEAMREAAAGEGAFLVIRNHRDSALAGAIGAAIWGAFRVRKLAGKGQPLGASRSS